MSAYFNAICVVFELCSSWMVWAAGKEAFFQMDRFLRRPAFLLRSEKGWHCAPGFVGQVTQLQSTPPKKFSTANKKEFTHTEYKND